MKIGIIVAMGKELQFMLPLLSNQRETVIAGNKFYTGSIGDHDVTLYQCGIGKVNAALGAYMMITHFEPQLVINSGVAGAADKSVSVMDIVVGAKVAYHDVWCGPESIWGAVQGLPLYYVGAEPVVKALENEKNVRLGLICSGDQFIDTLDAVLSIKDKFPEALAVDMESGAIAQVCYLNKVPFVSMRIISDSPMASHDNTQDYNDFWEAAPQQTFNLISNLLTKLSNINL